MATGLRKVEVVDNYKEQLTDKISISTKQGMYLAAKNGRVVSKSAYGYKITENKTLKVDEIEARNVKCIFSWAEEGLKVRKIGEFLKESEVPTPSEYRKRVVNPTCIWSASTIFQILRNKVYTGVYVYGVHSINSEIMEIEGNHEAIISMEQYEKVQAILKERTHIPKRK